MIKKIVYISPSEIETLRTAGTITVGTEVITLENKNEYDLRVRFEEKWVPGTGTGSLVTKDNVGGTAAGNYALAEGYGTDANANYSHVEGQLTSTVSGADCSHAEGQSTVAGAPCVHVEGMNTVSNNVAEHAQGQYNKSNKASSTFGNAGNTTDSIGIGTSLMDAKNAEETMQNGDKYIIGIGGYDGTNPGDADTLQETVEAIQDDIEDLQVAVDSGVKGSTNYKQITYYEVGSDTAHHAKIYIEEID